MIATVTCPVCKRAFTRSRGPSCPPKFCSRACANRAPGRMTDAIRAKIASTRLHGEDNPRWKGGKDAPGSVAHRLPAATRKRNLKHKYGLTEETYAEMLAAQDGGCSICRVVPELGTHLDVDHDHTTGEVRGLLCRRCNVALGGLRDSPDLVERALTYLRNGG